MAFVRLFMDSQTAKQLGTFSTIFIQTGSQLKDQVEGENCH